MVKLMTLPDKSRGVTWPPTARVVRCQVKSCNERDPCFQLQTISPEVAHFEGTAPDKGEEGMGDGRSVWPESLGQHASCNGRDNGMPRRKAEQIP